jgi:hypothetical protein
MQCPLNVLARRSRMRGTHVEYMGFSTGETTRRYKLRVRKAGGETHIFTLSIPSEAFASRRVRYQDGPEICFRKLQLELSECGEILPELNMDVTEAELEDFRLARMPKAMQRLSRPSVPS